MKIIKLSKQDEEKWLEDIKSDREEFLCRLHRILLQRDNNIKIKVSNDLLTALFLDCHNIDNSNNEYKESYYTFFKYQSIDNTTINYILSKFDLTGFKYHNLKLDNNALKIMSDCKIVLDLNNLYGQQNTQEYGTNMEGYNFSNLNNIQTTTTTTTSETTTTTSATTTTAAPVTTTTEDGSSEMPKTGYPVSFGMIAGLAALMTAAGAVLVIRNRKENE